jgi:1-hydroxycarotenoid 3,4-desaturase
MSARATVAEIGTVVVIGGGIGGLSAAIQAAALGCSVVLVEKGETLGGKMRELSVAGRPVDSGPTVLTMRWAFERLFSAAGRQLDDYVELAPLEILARHAWPDGTHLDLFADLDASASAITKFSSSADADGYRRFCEHTAEIFSIVKQPFLESERPSMTAVITARGLRGTMEFARIDWHRSMWRALESFFVDPRLRQLFGRYATYYGSSPFRAPATLNLIAHVERDGVWRVVGGMYRLAEALERCATELGVAVRTGCEVAEILVDGGRAVGVKLRSGERIEAAAVIVNAAPQALDEGRLGSALRGCVGLTRGTSRSLSAVTWSTLARTRGFPLAHHNVLFSRDYPREFRALERGELIDEPTVYVHAQDRLDQDPVQNHDRPRDRSEWSEPERLLILVNAPPRGDRAPWSASDLDALERRSFAILRDCGLELDPLELRRTAPEQFEELFPATGGALYGFATHSMMAPFQRPAARTKLARLYLAGGGAHPGAGIPMVCLSGQIAGRAAAEDLDR